MKRFILFTGVFLLTLLQAKAQQEKQEMASTSYLLLTGNTVIKENQPVNLSYNPGFHGPAKDYDYYLRKKKNNLTAGLVTLGGGLLLSGVGLLTASNSKSFDTDATAAVLFIAGAAAGIASIPLMIMSGVYAHKAKLELRKQKTGFGVPSNVSKDIVGITIKIPLGN